MRKLFTLRVLIIITIKDIVTIPFIVIIYQRLIIAAFKD